MCTLPVHTQAILLYVRWDPGVTVGVFATHVTATHDAGGFREEVGLLIWGHVFPWTEILKWKPPTAKAWPRVGQMNHTYLERPPYPSLPTCSYTQAYPAHTRHSQTRFLRNFRGLRCTHSTGITDGWEPLHKRSLTSWDNIDNASCPLPAPGLHADTHPDKPVLAPWALEPPISVSYGDWIWLPESLEMPCNVSGLGIQMENNLSMVLKQKEKY